MQRRSWTTELRSSSQIYLDVPNFLRIFCEKISQCSWIVFSGVSLLLLEGEFSYSSFLFVDDGMFFLCIAWFASFFCYCMPLLMHCCFPSFCQQIVPLSRGYYDLLSRRLMAVPPFPLSTSLLLFTCMILFWIQQTQFIFFFFCELGDDARWSLSILCGLLSILIARYLCIFSYVPDCYSSHMTTSAVNSSWWATHQLACHRK